MTPYSFDNLRHALEEELSVILTELSRDLDNYGFALDVPKDYGSACLLYTIGKESTLDSKDDKSKRKSKLKSLQALDNRYSPVEWMENWLWLPQSNNILKKLVDDFSADYQKTKNKNLQGKMHDEFITSCASACLDVLKECNSAGLFGNIWYKIVVMSDEEHPIVAEAFRTLNSGRAIDEAATVLFG